MGNKIRIKQIDLQGIFSASNQVDILSASNYAQFVTQLDTTMSSDAELSAVSSSISQSIYTINQVIGSGLISGSSQLTSSYDTRYILSGSITQTTWDNISGKPAGLVSESTDLTSLNQFTSSIQTQVDGISAQTSSYLTSSGSVDYSDITNIPSGIVSQSTDLTHLNSFTSSYYTDSSSFDTRIGNEKGRIDAILSASSADKDSFAEIVSLINSVDLTNDNAFATFYTSSNSRISSLENSTGSYETKGSGILSGSVSYLDLTNVPSGIVSQSTDLSQLNLFTQSIEGRVENLENSTGSYLTSLPSDIVSGSSQLTSSFDTRYTLSGSVQPLPSNLISGSSQLTSSFDTRYAFSSSLSSISSSFNSRFDGLVTTGSNTFSGSQVFSGSMTVTSGQIIASTITNDSSSLYLISGSNLYVQNDGIVEITGSIILNGTTYTSLTGSGTIPDGTISGSSQLTSSFDERYTLSGSVQPLPNGLISGSVVEISDTAPSTPTGSLWFDITDGNLYINYSGSWVSADGNNVLSAQTASYVLPSGLPSGIISGSSQVTMQNAVTASKVSVVAYGYSGDFPLVIMPDPGSSTSSPVGIGLGGLPKTNASTGIITANGFTGSLFGTSSYSTYAKSGPFVSGSSQITSSLDDRYVLITSFENYTSSQDIFNDNVTDLTSKTGSYASTGSNEFIGNQIIQGSLTGSFFTTNNQNLVLSTTNNVNSSTGTITINSGSNGEIRIAANGSGLISTTNGSRGGIHRLNTVVSGSGFVEKVIEWDSNGSTIPQFTLSNGVFTNTSSRTRTFIFSMQVAVQAISTGFGEVDIWFSQSGTFSGTNRKGQTAYYGPASAAQILSTTWNCILTPNDTIRCYIWCDQSFKIGDSAFGNNQGYSCHLQISEII